MGTSINCFFCVDFVFIPHVDSVDFSLARQISSKLDLLSLNRKVRKLEQAPFLSLNRTSEKPNF